MEKVKELLAKANILVKKADHLTYITYPLINETKLLYSIIESLSQGVTTAMDAVLYYDRLYKRISRQKGSFRDELDIFARHSMSRYNINRKHILLIQDLHAIVNAKKRSPMEFVRKDKFVICTSSYKMKILKLQQVKQYLAQSKSLITEVNRAIRC